MAETKFPTFALLTDAPPLKEGGHGCNVLAWNWLHAMRHDVRLVVTRQLNRTFSPERVAAASPRPVLFYPDMSWLAWPEELATVRSVLEMLVLLISLPKIARAVRASGAERLFAFFGGNSWFLFVARWVAAATGLPLDVYLVEDLQESERIHRHWLAARVARWYEPRLLRYAARVFAISPGFVEHLAARYGVRAAWLPVPIVEACFQYRPLAAGPGDARRVTFIGGVNSANADALRDVLRAVEEWNAGRPPFELRLLVMTYSTPPYLQPVFGASPHVDVLHDPPRTEMEERLRESWALLIPYSFSAAMRTMVSTAFATKLTDLLPIGRPILVYGPPYASLPRYFRENGLPVCAHTATELAAAWQELNRHDAAPLMQCYGAVIQQWHSPAHVRSVVAGFPG